MQYGIYNLCKLNVWLQQHKVRRKEIELAHYYLKVDRDKLKNYTINSRVTI